MKNSEKSLVCPACGSTRFRIVTQQTASCDLTLREVLHCQDEEINTLSSVRCDTCEAETDDAAIIEAVHALFAEATDVCDSWEQDADGMKRYGFR